MECDILQSGRTKGHGKNKGSKLDKSRDQCHHCGRVGHWKSDCWLRDKGHVPIDSNKNKGKGKGKKSGKHVSEVQVNNSESSGREENCSTLQADSSDKDKWLFTLIDWVQVVHREQITQGWLDSACVDHVCPLDFASDYPLEDAGTARVRAADGRELYQYGTRSVRLLVGNEQILVLVRFRVLNVTRVLL